MPSQEAAQMIDDEATQRSKKSVSKAMSAKMLINSCITSAADTGDMEKLLAAIGDNLPRMNGINLATAMHRLGKVATLKETKHPESVASHPTFERFYKVLQRSVMNHPLRGANIGSGRVVAKAEVPVQCVSVIAWGCAVMKIRDQGMFGALSEIAAASIFELQPFELAQLLWAYAKVGIPSEELFAVVAWRLCARGPGEFRGLCLSMIAWAFATLEVYDIELFRSISDEIMEYVHEFRLQDIANTAKAFAKAGLYDPALFQCLSKAAVAGGNLSLFKPQELTDLLWAFAQVGVREPAIRAAAFQAVLRKRWQLSSDNLATAVAALLKLGCVDSENSIGPFVQVFVSKGRSVSVKDLTKVLSGLLSLKNNAAKDTLQFLGSFELSVLEATIAALSNTDFLTLSKVILETRGVKSSVTGLVAREGVQRVPSLSGRSLLALLRCTFRGYCCSSRRANFKHWHEAVVRYLLPYVSSFDAGSKAKLHSTLMEFDGTPGMHAARGLKDAIISSAALKPYSKKWSSVTTTASESDLSERLTDSKSSTELSAKVDADGVEERCTGFGFSTTSVSSLDMPGGSPQDALRLPNDTHRLETCPNFWDDSEDAEVGTCGRPSSADSCLFGSARRYRTLSKVLESDELHWAVAAGIVYSAFKQTIRHVNQYGPAAVHSLRCSNILVDEELNTFLPVSFDSEASWASALTGFDPPASGTDAWRSLVLRLGMVLRCACVTRRGDPCFVTADKSVTFCPAIMGDLITSCFGEQPPTQTFVGAALESLASASFMRF